MTDVCFKVTQDKNFEVLLDDIFLSKQALDSFY